MTEQEEKFVHFASCITSLNNAWCILQTIQTQPGNPLVGAAFRFALVEYCKAYKSSRRINKKPLYLKTELIPHAYIPLHERIITSRDQIHAHCDLTVMEAKLHVHEFMGQTHAQISQNVITGLEELPNLQEINALIEGTLKNMYIKEKKLEAAL
jgi:hypothetical protein